MPMRQCQKNVKNFKVKNYNLLPLGSVIDHKNAL